VRYDSDKTLGHREAAMGKNVTKKNAIRAVLPHRIDAPGTRGSSGLHAFARLTGAAASTITASSASARHRKTAA